LHTHTILSLSFSLSLSHLFVCSYHCVLMRVLTFMQGKKGGGLILIKYCIIYHTAITLFLHITDNIFHTVGAREKTPSTTALLTLLVNLQVVMLSLLLQLARDSFFYSWGDQLD
jgi:hypothetical protein